jgi:hypothetical protein
MCLRMMLRVNPPYQSPVNIRRVQVVSKQISTRSLETRCKVLFSLNLASIVVQRSKQ